MKHLITAAALAVVLGGCTLSSGPTAAKGQEFCAKATADGPLVVALVDAAASAAGQPEAVLVTGLASDVVADACKAWNPAAVPVVPPTTPVPTVAIVPPVS